MMIDGRGLIVGAKTGYGGARRKTIVYWDTARALGGENGWFLLLDY